MEKIKLLITKPFPHHADWKHRVVIGITKVGTLGYVIQNPFTLMLEYISKEEYVELEPKPDNELEVLRKKVYQYELLITKLLAYPDLMVIAAVKNELDHMRNGEYENKRE